VHSTDTREVITGGGRLFQGLTNPMQNPSWLVKI